MSELKITFLRTSSALIEYGDHRLLTDPWFQMNMRGLPVFRRPGIELSDVPRLDLVVASHLHRDHFDKAAVQQLSHDDLVVVGTTGTDAHCRSLGLPRVVDLAPWQEKHFAPFKLTATPALHTGPPPDEVNFVIEVGGQRVFFGGDARWSRHYEEIAERLGPVDVALLPIGGTLIFGRRTTMGPTDAVRACNALRPRWAIPIHEGGEWLPVPPASWHPGRNHHFVDRLAASGLQVEPCVLAPGQTAVFDGQGLRYETWQPTK